MEREGWNDSQETPMKERMNLYLKAGRKTEIGKKRRVNTLMELEHTQSDRSYH